MTDGKRKALELLAQELEKDAERLLKDKGEISSFYPELPASFCMETDSFPEKFDLRERGVLTPVKKPGLGGPLGFRYHGGVREQPAEHVGPDV